MSDFIEVGVGVPGVKGPKGWTGFPGNRGPAGQEGERITFLYLQVSFDLFQVPNCVTIIQSNYYI